MVIILFSVGLETSTPIIGSHRVTPPIEESPVDITTLKRVKEDNPSHQTPLGPPATPGVRQHPTGPVTPQFHGTPVGPTSQQTRHSPLGPPTSSNVRRHPIGSATPQFHGTPVGPTNQQLRSNPIGPTSNKGRQGAIGSVTPSFHDTPASATDNRHNITTDTEPQLPPVQNLQDVFQFGDSDSAFDPSLQHAECNGGKCIFSLYKFIIIVCICMVSVFLLCLILLSSWHELLVKY